AAPESAETHSQSETAARYAVHLRGWSPPVGEIISASGSVVALPARAESTTQTGVTPITLIGGESNSLPTLHPMTSARPETEASVRGLMRIVVRRSGRTFHTCDRRAITSSGPSSLLLGRHGRRSPVARAPRGLEVL